MKMSQKRAKISEIVFTPTTPNNKGLICFVSFTYSNLFRIQECAIITKLSGGYRLSFPIKHLSNGKSSNVVYPISKEVAKPIEDFVLLEYDKFVKKNTKD
jgi:DNA-binding cell septation regulator SpoVG